MWLFTSGGLLMPSARPPKTVPLGDDRTLQIRARRWRDLDRLRTEYMQGKLGPIMHTPKMDYEFRAYCTPEAFAWAVFQMIMGIDYQKFKPTTEDRYGDKELHTAYNAVWATVMTHLGSWERYAAAQGKPSPYPKRAASNGVDLAKPGVGNADYSTSTSKKTVYTVPPESITDLGTDPLGSFSTGWPATSPYNSSFYRDDDARDDDPWATDATSDRAYIDYLYDQAERLERDLRDDAPMSHKDCAHNGSDNSRARCRRRHRRHLADELAKVRAEIDEMTHLVNKSNSNGEVAESSTDVTVAAGGGNTA